MIDYFIRAIVGRRATQVTNTAMITPALKMAPGRRDREGRRVDEGLIHHSDAGSQCTSIACTETLGFEGVAASISGVGDAYSNAPAEKTTGLFRTEVIRRGSPLRCVQQGR